MKREISCPYGHNDWTQYWRNRKDPQMYWRCRECHRIKSKARYDRTYTKKPSTEYVPRLTDLVDPLDYSHPLSDVRLGA